MDAKATCIARHPLPLAQISAIRWLCGVARWRPVRATPRTNSIAWMLRRGVAGLLLPSRCPVAMYLGNPPRPGWIARSAFVTGWRGPLKLRPRDLPKEGVHPRANTSVGQSRVVHRASRFASVEETVVRQASGWSRIWDRLASEEEGKFFPGPDHPAGAKPAARKYANWVDEDSAMSCSR